MKKLLRVLIVVMLTVFVFNVNGQNVGIKVGSVWSNATIKPNDTDIDQQFLISPKLGIIFETPLYENIFLQTGLYGSLSGYRYDSKREIDGTNDTKIWVDSKERPILLYIDLPVNFGYKHPISDELSIFGMAGPVFRYLAYSTHSFKVDGEWDNESTKVEIDGKEEELFKKFDIGLNIEAGVQFQRFEFALYYAPSFSNILNEDLFEDAVSWKNYSFGVTFGVLLGDLK